jgi:hypothetical protein
MWESKSNRNLNFWKICLFNTRKFSRVFFEKKKKTTQTFAGYSTYKPRASKKSFREIFRLFHPVTARWWQDPWRVGIWGRPALNNPDGDGMNLL